MRPTDTSPELDVCSLYYDTLSTSSLTSFLRGGGGVALMMQPSPLCHPPLGLRRLSPIYTRYHPPSCLASLTAESFALLFAIIRPLVVCHGNGKCIPSVAADSVTWPRFTLRALCRLHAAAESLVQCVVYLCGRARPPAEQV